MPWQKLHPMSKHWHPPLDVYEVPETVIILMEIPGVKKEDIDVRMDGEMLTISGSRPDMSPDGRIRCHQLEINSGRFMRKVRVSLPIKAEAIQASYNDGFLKIVLPREG